VLTASNLGPLFDPEPTSSSHARFWPLHARNRTLNVANFISDYRASVRKRLRYRDRDAMPRIDSIRHSTLKPCCA
jgi:hypothetical protein